MKVSTRKIMPAFLLLLLSAVIVATSTFAWFSMNTTVQVTGMSLKAVTPANLLISLEEDGTYSNVVSITENSNKKLYPVSTNAPNEGFIAIKSGKMIGSAGQGGVAPSGAELFNVAENSSAEIEQYRSLYTLYFKASEELEEDLDVYLSSLNIFDRYIASGDEVNVASGGYYEKEGESYVPVSGDSLTSSGLYYRKNISKAVRVCIYVPDEDVYYIYSTEGYDASTNYFVPGQIPDEAIYNSAELTSGLDGNGAPINSELSSDKSFKVNSEPISATVFVWIEGQDSNCINANSGATFDIDLEFSIKK
ncbi:MAG: hypothetical protein J6Y68_04165 [Clostridia bacterium]|nr:hypothetical protein [Clostridia bacterium]MBP5593029.1 hypothetical protein [Clostridia bacterium]